jgi:hypothetical protein
MDKSFENFEGRNGVITVKSIYGENVYETPIKMINDGERVGVVVRGHELFLYRDEILHIMEAEDGLLIVGQSMSIEIRCC